VPGKGDGHVYCYARAMAYRKSSKPLLVSCKVSQGRAPRGCPRSHGSRRRFSVPTNLLSSGGIRAFGVPQTRPPHWCPSQDLLSRGGIRATQLVPVPRPLVAWRYPGHPTGARPGSEHRPRTRRSRPSLLSFGKEKVVPPHRCVLCQAPQKLRNGFTRQRLEYSNMKGGPLTHGNQYILRLE
jgi:hypothetical protein